MSKYKYKFDTGKRYKSRGINTKLPIPIQVILWSILDQHLQSETEIDYLQIFKFVEENGILAIKHSQEQPDYKKQYTMRMCDEYRVLTGSTIYIIDDKDHSTMLFAEEY